MKSSALLSKYQRAVLSELGIVAWKKQNHNVASLHSQGDYHDNDAKASSASASAISQSSALDKLQQLKSSNSVSYRGKVVCSFDEATVQSQMVGDVLLALGLSVDTLLCIDIADLNLAKDVTLCWKISDKVSLTDRQLTTPVLNRLSAADKKQLWQSIQSFNLK